MFAGAVMLAAGLRAEEPMWLKGTQADLRFDGKGVSLVPSSGVCPPVEATGAPVWALELEPEHPASRTRERANVKVSSFFMVCLLQFLGGPPPFRTRENW
jgi:hypothetical protein